MYSNQHGGDCCGLSHVIGFHPTVTEAAKRELERRIEEAVDEVEEDCVRAVDWKTFGHAIEVTLTDQQMMEWAKTLKQMGFKLCFRWKNDNSGNYCNLLMYSTKKVDKSRPYKW